MLGSWLPFPSTDWTQVPEGPGVYALADGKEIILAIASATHLRTALQELAAAPPQPLRDLATHLWVEATPEPERRRADLIAELRTHTGAFPPCNRRHPRYPARLPAWWAAQRGAQGSPAETVNVSSKGLLLALPEPPLPDTGLWIWLETPFGLVGVEGRICWAHGEGQASRAGVALTALRAPGDLLRWERLIGQLAERVAHAYA